MACARNVPGFAIADGVAANSNSTISFAISKEPEVNSLPSIIEFTTRNGTAVAGRDFVATSGRMTFAALETLKTVNVVLIGEAALADRWFEVRIRIIQNGKLRDSVGVGLLRQTNVLLLEDDGYWLLEDGGSIILEDA